MTRIGGRTVALALLSGGIGLALLIAIGLIGYQVLGGEALVDDVSCHLGFSTDCVHEELEQKRRELEDLQDRTRDLEALYERLKRLDYASESFVVFYTDTDGRYPVTSGHRYASLIEPGRFTAGWCYIDLPDTGGISRDLFIAHLDPGEAVRPSEIDARALSRSGLTEDDVTRGLTRCRWPAGVS